MPQALGVFVVYNRVKRSIMAVWSVYQQIGVDGYPNVWLGVTAAHRDSQGRLDTRSRSLPILM